MLHTILNKPANKAQTLQAHGPVTMVAVLPFENLTGNVEQDYFSRGFVEDLVIDISHFPDIEILSTHTSQSLNFDNPDALQSVGVDFLIKGNLRKAGKKLRIGTQLVNAHNGLVLWAEKYDVGMEAVFEVQDDIVNKVVEALSKKMNASLISALPKKTTPKLHAYDYWLHGFEYLRQGNLINDEKARDLFKQALEIDPGYGRAYAGLSLSYFNEWSCQLWDRWDKNMQMAFEYAAKAIHLDENDHVSHMVLGRIYLYRRLFDQAEMHFRRSLELNYNDADSLVQISWSLAMLGHIEEGLALFNRAKKLNPLHGNWYYVFGLLPQFILKQFEQFINSANDISFNLAVDFPAYKAAAYAWIGDNESAEYHINLFRRSFEDKITFGRKAEPGEGFRWIRLVNPYKRKEDWEIVKTGLIKAGLAGDNEKIFALKPDNNEETTYEAINIFKQENEFWHINFENKEVRIPAVKGFYDISFLLARAGDEIHCSELMGSSASFAESQPMIDEKARREYEQRIRDLQSELHEAENMNDEGRAEILNEELDKLIDHLSKSTGLRGKSRQLDPASDKARSAVTWRIRNAIKKIETVHPVLARHLSNTIQTGTFCGYFPEKEQYWLL